MRQVSKLKTNKINFSLQNNITKYKNIPYRITEPLGGGSKNEIIEPLRYRKLAGSKGERSMVEYPLTMSSASPLPVAGPFKMPQQ